MVCGEITLSDDPVVHGKSDTAAARLDKCHSGARFSVFCVLVCVSPSLCTMQIDTERFILEVEKRPALYNRRLNESCDTNEKKRLWLELCEMFIENWNELSPAEKRDKGKDLQSKWKNLRTCFQRECNAQTSETPGPRGKKRRKYMYFDQMLFLLPTSKDKETAINVDSQNNDRENGNLEEMKNGIEGEGFCIAEHESANFMHQATNANTTVSTTIGIHTRKTKSERPFEEQLLEILSEMKDRDKEIDEDKYFLLSLLPSFRKLNDDQKFFARCEFLNTLRQAQQLAPYP
ncbi:uncharacterized protein LOC143019011 [Oratosquilla oratoria]|uniref:uncharacterized protein LOC143019011 n=1 Tax=Oratosquilla oratoria TaxID=337810 RepID=UPI003F75E469